jgi:hypothetical protein
MLDAYARARIHDPPHLHDHRQSTQTIILARSRIEDTSPSIRNFDLFSQQIEYACCTMTGLLAVLLAAILLANNMLFVPMTASFTCQNRLLLMHLARSPSCCCFFVLTFHTHTHICAHTPSHACARYLAPSLSLSLHMRAQVVPFAAILDGRQTLPPDVWKEFARAPYALIAVGTLGAYAAHPYMQAGAALVRNVGLVPGGVFDPLFA